MFYNGQQVAVAVAVAAPMAEEEEKEEEEYKGIQGMQRTTNTNTTDGPCEADWLCYANNSTKVRESTTKTTPLCLPLCPAEYGRKRSDTVYRPGRKTSKVYMSILLQYI